MRSSLRLAFAAVLLCFSAASCAQPGAPLGAVAYTSVAKSALVDFRYSFPTVVGSSPRLLARLRNDEQKNRSDELQVARKEAQFRADKHYPFHPHQFWRDWTITGQTARLLGLQSRTETFEGGAHPNHTSAWLLWDTTRDEPVGIDDLFQSRGDLWGAVKAEYCRSLDAERRRRSSSGSICPSPEQLTIEFLDTDLDWSFETIRIIADPYVAGPYSDGTYAITLPVTAQLIAMLKPKYRDSFEAQRQ